MAETTINVNIILYSKPIPVPYNSSTTAEDVCIHICKQLSIGNLTRHLFALRETGRNVFMMPAATIADRLVPLDFRIRFKVDNINKLRKLDINAYNYYFHQSRNDVLENKIPDIIFEKYRRELVGLGITDMYRVMLEKDIPRETVEGDYKKYIPKEVLRRHHFFIKKPIHDTLGRLQKSVHDAWYVKSEYLRQLETIAPEYLSEVYKADMDHEGSICKIIIKVSPYHPTEPGIRYAVESKKDEWLLICSIEDLGFISIRHDGTIELSRKNGIPFYLKFQSLEKMYSFISLLDGYYRLTCKWIFNICREVYTPSLQKLLAMKCHGPVGGEFSYSKLESKRNNRPGCFIVRESETKYNDFYIDVCLKEGMKPKTFKLEKLPGDEFIFMDDLTKYKSIHQLTSAYNDPNGAIFLQECLPPSEYDISPLLLCKSEHLIGNSLTDSSALDVLIPSQPMCINCKNLQVYKDRNCLKWNKNRNKVKQKENVVSIKKFKKELFPENSLSQVKKYCRNPDGDIGGPWCFIEDEDSNEIYKEYCDIPFCDDPTCLVFTKDHERYTHYTDFNHTLANISFGVKLWDPDMFLNANARLVLSVMALPLTGPEFDKAGIGLEIFIGNNYSTLKYGNKDTPEYEATTGILKSTEFVQFYLNWHGGFITFGVEGVNKPIFLAEYNIKNNLLGHKKNQFLFYSVQGTNVLWNFPFCVDDCDVHTTTGKYFQQFWPMRQHEQGIDLYVHVRALQSASILFVPTPTVNYPHVKLVLSDSDNFTKITAVEYEGGPELLLKEMQIGGVLDYWTWQVFSITFFANSLHIYVKKPLGMQILTDMKSNFFRNVRWFSVSSSNTVAHWSFYCDPPHSANPPMAVPPECALEGQEHKYAGKQNIANNGLPCLPWLGNKLHGMDSKDLFSKESVGDAWNYCRNPQNEREGAFCYTISITPQTIIEKTRCSLRRCRSAECRMAGTGNDFIGALSTTRSNKTCDIWDLTINSPNSVYKKIWNGTLFSDQSSSAAKNYCRNPDRNVTGSWCYTTDPKIIEDSCNVRDCDKPEECIVIVETTSVIDRRIFILPQWKERGHHGGLRFSLKEWDPEILDGFEIVILPKTGSDHWMLQIGADYNERVKLFRNGEVIITKTMPHMVLAGSWNDLWLQIRKGEIMLGFQGVPTAILEWSSQEMDKEFEPFYIKYGSIYGKNIGVYFKCDECHTENITQFFFQRYFPIGMWREERPLFNNFTLNIRGVGATSINFMWVVGNYSYYNVRLHNVDGKIYFSKMMNKNVSVFAMEEVENLLQPDVWIRYDFYFSENDFKITRNNETVFYIKDERLVMVYWFGISAELGWTTWSANCDPLDIDGPPRDGGWSGWSPWTCTVSCGGGEGFRTRTCSNPRPNIAGAMCQGDTILHGKCNEFPCGDISDETIELITANLREKNFSYVIDEGTELLLQNNHEILRRISKESPNAYFEWTLNGLFIKADLDHISFPRNNILLRNAKKELSGLYVCMLYRINKKRVVLRLISVAVKSKRFDYDTRVSRDLTIKCNAVILGKKKEGKRGITYVYRSMWIITKGKKIECAIKMLNQELSEKYSKDFLMLAGQWAFLQSSAIVRLYGITLTSNISLVSEYIRLGPLDEYLRQNHNIVKTVDLIEAASNLASALWHLTENNVVHGRIRCRKLLVSTHDENSFTVKLADPGIYTDYASSEIHWIPVECYSRLEVAKRSIEADVWAFGTTLWEIFMYGKEIKASDQDMSFYMNGMRLPQPPSCSKEIYTLMKECWDLDPHKRKKPQAIMRDINQFWYQVYNSRRTHSYAKIFNTPNGMHNSAGTSTMSLYSSNTESTMLAHDDVAGSSGTSTELTDFSQKWIKCYSDDDDNEDSYAHHMSNLFSNHLSTATTSLDSLNSMQSVFELDGSCNVVLQGRIGQGFYGEVYKGTLEYIDGQDKDPRKVAVKKLKAPSLSSYLQDFEREINIMKALNHPNIVEILGVLREPEISLVMEFVPHGSLLSYLNYKDNLEEKTLLKYAHDIANGMHYLGTKNIVHRDLAARNILVVNEEHVKISDFGLAQVMETDDYYILKTPNRELPIKWYAPESLRDGKFSSRSDVWSYGVTMCEMFNYGEEPNLANMEKGSEGTQQHVLLQALESGARFPCPANCPRGVFVRIINPCWNKDPHQRPTFAKLTTEIDDLLTQY